MSHPPAPPFGTPSHPSRWRGQTALVTGASAGLGEEFARQLAAGGVHLVLTARRRERLEALADELMRLHGVRVAVEPADLSAPGGAAALCDVLLARELDIDLLIANAGFGTGGAFLDAKCESQAEMVRVNCEALVVLTHRLLPAMVARRQGAIVHVASIAAMQPIPFMATYGATKAFVLSFSQAVSEEVRPSGVRVLALCPGPVRTEFQAVAGMDIAPSQKAAILSSEETVRLGLRALEEDAGVYVPGAVNRLGQLGARLLPRRVKLRVVSRIMRDKGRSSSSS